jgi:hypothetical protein
MNVDASADGTPPRATEAADLIVCHDAAVLRRRWRAALLAMLVLVLGGAVPALAAPIVLALPLSAASVSGTTFSQPMDDGYLGFSFEYRALHQYTGRDPAAINPLLLGLIGQLNPGQQPLIRIGGDSSDDTWWPMRGVVAPGGVNYALTKDWLSIARAFAQDLHARLTLGVNLEAGRPQLAAVEARALLAGVGSRNIAALEIGNEPDLYSSFFWYGNRLGQAFFGRPPTYTFGNFISEFDMWRAAMPPIPLAGPTLSSLTWMQNLPSFLAAERAHLSEVTFHRYPLRGCQSDTTASNYASIPNLLGDGSAAGLAAGVQPYVQEASADHLPFRLDELNSAACTGRTGVSDTFASALWVLDTLFNMAAVGVDGISLHTLPKSAYEPFTFSESRRGVWSVDVRPVYYGMLMFAQADPPGSRLLDVTATSGPLKAWAVQTPSGHTNVVLINKSTTTNYSVHVTIAGAQPALSSESLQAPSLSSTSGVTIGGQTFPLGTTSSKLAGTPVRGTVTPALGGGYDVTVPVAGAVMLSR